MRILFLLLCTSVYGVANAQAPMYKVRKIKDIGKFYVIYAIKDDTTYKIISKKEKIDYGIRVRKNESYPFKVSIIKSLSSGEVDCFSFDENTTTCKDDNAELALSSNLKGLCIIEK